MALILCLWVPVSRTAFGDQVRTDGANYPGAVIVGFEEGQLQFRTAAGKLKAVWLSDVDLVIVDRRGLFADVNQAERYLAGGEPDRAIERYRRALKLTDDFWSDFIRARLVTACDRADRLEQAVRNFIRVVNGEASGPALAARLMPEKSVPATRGEVTSRAIKELDKAIKKVADEQREGVLRLLRYEILRKTGDKRAAGAAPTIATLPIPASARIERVYAILWAALARTLEQDTGPAMRESLDRAIRWCPEQNLPSFLMLKGRTLARLAETPEDIIRASWAFLRVAIHMPDDPQAPEALYEAALALERLGCPDKAVSLLDECLAHKRLSDKTGTLARTALERLKSTFDPSS